MKTQDPTRTQNSRRTQDPRRAQDLMRTQQSYEDTGPYEGSEFFDDPGKTQELFSLVCLIWWNLQTKVDLYYVYTRANYYGFKINLDLL